MEHRPGEDHELSRRGGRRPQPPPPPAAIWPAARTAEQGQQQGIAAKVPSWSGFDEDFEVHLPGRGRTTFLVRVAGRELATTRGVAVVIHGGGFTGMSWAPAAGVMKRDCCVLAPDLRDHGLTLSAGTDVDTGTQKESDEGDSGDGNDDNAGDGAGVAQNALMSLESLAEDVTSLLVEIFTSGLLLRPKLPRRQREQRKQEQGPQQQPQQQQQQPSRTAPPPTQGLGGCNPASSCSSGSDPPSRSPAAVGARPPMHDSEGHNGEGDDTIKTTAITAITITTTSDNTSRAGGPQGSNPATPPGAAAAAADGDGSGDGGSSCTSSPIKLLLVGHSLGGSIAVRVAGAAEELRRRCRGTAEVAGVVAVDVVEGTALSALDDMPEIMRKIPRSFPSMEDAVLWHVKTGAVRNSTSAHAVVPSRLKNDGARDGRVVWRTDLLATERHWRNWFEGMSKAFLDLPVPKLLVVAGMDRLDSELTAAHMQGRFQLKLVYGCGHSVQEDQPDETAASIINFALRNSIFRRGASGATNGGRPGGEEEELLRLKLARAREQAKQSRR